MKRKKEIKNSNKKENNISKIFFSNKNLRENSMKEELKTIYNEGSMVENHEKVIMLLKEITKEEVIPPKEMTLQERIIDKIKRGYKIGGRRKTWPKWLQEAVPRK